MRAATMIHRLIEQFPSNKADRRRSHGCCVLTLACLFLSTNLHAGATAVAIDADDVIAAMDASLTEDTNTWSGVECNGVYKPLSALINRSVRGTERQGSNSLRLGRTPDPLNGSRMVMGFRVDQDDALTAGARRCELAAYNSPQNAIPARQRVWYAFSLLADKASSRLERDDQLLTQWHVRGFIGFSPFMALYVSNGILRFEVRHNSLAAGTPMDTRKEVLWRAPLATPARWTNFVVEARVSPLITDRPFIRIWQDGRLIVDHAGPIGYNTEAMAFAKIGLYHWINANNEWDAAVPVRSAYFAKALLVRDTNGRYSEALLRRQLEKP